MKTKEEIEKLAVDIIKTRFNQTSGYHKVVYVEAYVKAYMQCQEDMTDMKYTEEDIRKAIQVGISAEAGDYPEGWGYKLGITLEDYYINSLNKQNNG